MDHFNYCIDAQNTFSVWEVTITYFTVHSALLLCPGSLTTRTVIILMDQRLEAYTVEQYNSV